jgi:hypothetical protein
LSARSFQEQRIHRALEPDVQLGDLALRQRDDLHAGEHEALVDRGYILLVARQPVHGLGEDNIEPPAVRVMHKLLNARADERRTGDRPVRIAVDNLPSLALSMLATKPQLILNGSVALVLRGVASVKGDALHDQCPPKYSLLYRSSYIQKGRRLAELAQIAVSR